MSDPTCEIEGCTTRCKVNKTAPSGFARWCSKHAAYNAKYGTPIPPVRALPLEPLVKYMRAEAERAVGPDPTTADVARAAGVPFTTMAKWVERQESHTINVWRADEVCTAIGVHPTKVWGFDEWFAPAA